MRREGAEGISLLTQRAVRCIQITYFLGTLIVLSQNADLVHKQCVRSNLESKADVLV